jgi:NifU-like protein involved in Fe-S cluster formation
VNPLCGDRIRIECRIADGRLADARHRGDSCAICIASADVLLERAIGQPLDLVSRLTTADLLVRLETDIRASRIKCVTLPLTVLQGALEGREVAR